MIKIASTIVDITPYNDRGVKLAGFGPNRKSKGLLHPLKAGFLYITDGEKEVCFVTLDLIGLTLTNVERIRDMVNFKDQAGLIPCSTHTHAGPDTIGLWGFALLKLIPVLSGVDKDYMIRLEQKISMTVNELKASGGIAVKEIKIARFETDPVWTENARRGGLKEDAGFVFQPLSTNGKPICTLINFACHPETLWDKNKYISPDYPHFVREYLNNSNKAGIPLFFSGALGGMVTVAGADVAKSQEERLNLAKRIGYGVAERALKSLEQTNPVKIGKLDFKRKVIHIPLKNWRFKMGNILQILKRSFFNNEVRTEVNLISLGDIQIATAPGECLPEVGLKIKNEMSAKHKLLFCLGADELGYILDRNMFSDKEYSYECSMSVGPDTADKITNAIKEINYQN